MRHLQKAFKFFLIVTAITELAKAAKISQTQEDLLQNQCMPSNPLFDFLEQCPLTTSTRPTVTVALTAQAKRQVKKLSKDIETEDEKAVQDILGYLYCENAQLRCEYLRAFADRKKCPQRLEIATSSELSIDTNMQYFPATRTVSIKTGFAKECSLFNGTMKKIEARRAAHEIHHSAQSVTNCDLNSHYDKKYDNSLALPYTNRSEFLEFKAAINAGMTRVMQLVKSVLPGSGPKTAEFKEFEKLSLNYTPFIHQGMTHTLPQSLIKQWTAQGYINSRFDLLKPGGFKLAMPLTLYGTQYQIPLQIIGTDPSRFYFRMVSDLSERAKALLLDIYFTYSTVLKADKSDQEIVEVDAHIHQFLAFYPEIMSSLFKELSTYYLKRYGDTFQQCVTTFRPC